MSHENDHQEFSVRGRDVVAAWGLYAAIVLGLAVFSMVEHTLSGRLHDTVATFNRFATAETQTNQRDVPRGSASDVAAARRAARVSADNPRI